MFDPEKAGEAKYKIGDMVYYKIQTPKNALNNRINDTKFRQGDYRYDPVLRLSYYHPPKSKINIMLKNSSIRKSLIRKHFI